MCYAERMIFSKGTGAGMKHRKLPRSGNEREMREVRNTGRRRGSPAQRENQF